MAFNIGDYITAKGINDINKAHIWNSYNKTDFWGWNLDYRWYSHRKAGEPLAKVRIHGSNLGGIAYRFAKVDAANNVLQWIINKNYEGFWTGGFDEKLNINSLGPGWYRVWTAETANPSSKPNTGEFYSSQIDCQANKYLTLYDDPAVSGNRLIGSYITAELLNKGRGGTLN